MTKDDILRMAREAGGSFEELPLCDAWLFYEEEYLERFAKLVYEKAWADTALAATHTVTDAAIAKEREACAKVCDVFANHVGYADAQEAANTCADAIRARGQA
jgi:hypothetical protein